MKKSPFFLPRLALSLGLLPLVLGAAESSPFADKPSDSYSNYKGEDGQTVFPIWGTLRPEDFGSRPVTMDPAGLRPIRQVPAAGVHPRIVFTPDDLPDIRRRLKETRAGQRAWNNILAWTEMMKGAYDDQAPYAQPDVFKGSFGGLKGPVPLFRLGTPRASGKNPYNHSAPAAELYDGLAAGTVTEFPGFYWNVFALEAFRCLVAEDRAGGEKLARAVITAMKIDQAKRDAERAAKSVAVPPAEPVGRFQFAFCYDFLFNWLTPEQRRAMHAELAATTWSHDNYGTFNEATASRSNWATFSYWLFEVLAIEGEPGFNDLKVRGMYRGWRNLLTYGWFASGATFEGEAKNQLGMDGVLMFAMRAKDYGFDNLTAHPYLRAYATKFLPQSVNAMQTGFHKYDLLGGSRAKGGGFSSNDAVGLKWALPDDKVIDWIYRQTVGENYENVPDRPDGYYNALLFFAIFATDYNPANGDPAALNLGNTFFCPERALVMTRSSWSKNATQLNLHVRQANGGHPFADRNAIMLAGAGRIWSPNGYASFTAPENSVVSIEGKTQSENSPGRLVDYRDGADATFATGDAKYAWDWNWRQLDRPRGLYTLADVRAGKVDVPATWEPERHTINDFSFQRLPYAYLDTPMFEQPSWILPAGALRPVVRQENTPVQRAFRTAGLVRGDRPYALVLDDIQQDDQPRRYDWTLAVEPDVQIVKVTPVGRNAMDILLTGDDPDQAQPRPKEPLPAQRDAELAVPASQPMLLVRVLNATSVKPLEPTIVELPNARNPKKYAPIRRLVLSAESVAPDFKVLLYPHRQGDPLPATTWNAARTAWKVGWPGQEDEILFAPSKSGRTRLLIRRDGKELVRLDQEIPPLKEPTPPTNP